MRVHCHEKVKTLSPSSDVEIIESKAVFNMTEQGKMRSLGPAPAGLRVSSSPEDACYFHAQQCEATLCAECGAGFVPRAHCHQKRSESFFFSQAGNVLGP